MNCAFELMGSSKAKRLFTIYKRKPIGTRFVQMIGRNFPTGSSVGIGVYHLHSSFKFTDHERGWTEAKPWGNTNGKHVTVRKFRLEILDCLSRRPEIFGNFPITLNLMALPFIFQPKFPTFFVKW